MSIAKNAPKDCCGCNACAEICPRHCITMKRDKYGFLYPSVDASLCTECGACERVCPFISPSDNLSEPLGAYAACASDPRIYRTSSSGGAAYEIARQIIEQGGAVYGCAASGLEIKHIRVNDLAQLPLLQGSKYVQSTIQGCCRSIRSDLAAGLLVAFFGTPCQVAAVKKFIPKPSRTNLLLVDIICHGTPSPQMLEADVRSVAHGQPVDKISFRQGNSFILTLSSRGREIFSSDVFAQPFRDPYYRAFFDGTSYRPSCYNCAYARPERVSDITVGDFWGLQSAKEFSETHRDGISLLMPVTPKGQQIVAHLSQSMHLAQATVKEAVNGNTQLRHPMPFTRRGQLFRALYPALPFGLAVNLVYLDRRVRRALSPLKKILNGQYR